MFQIWTKRGRREVAEYPWEADAQQEFVLLEERARLRSRRRWTRGIVAGTIVFAYASAGAAVFYLNMSSPSSRASTELQPRPPAQQATEPARVIDTEAGFEFKVPEGWSADSSGSRTVVSSPDRDASVSIAVAPDGDISDSSKEIMANLAVGWVGVRSEMPLVRTVAGQPALSVGGTAIDATGPIRFLAIVVDGGERNYAIAVSVPRQRGTSFTPAIQTILSSFKPLGAA